MCEREREPHLVLSILKLWRRSMKRWVRIDGKVIDEVFGYSTTRLVQYICNNLSVSFVTVFDLDIGEKTRNVSIQH